MSIHLTNRIKEEIEKEAIRTLRDCDIHKLPVDINQLMSSKDIEIRYYLSCTEEMRNHLLKASTDGFTKRDGENSMIYINDNGMNIEERMRFTFMHELGHIVLNHLEHSELAEREADYFAGYILAPPVLIYTLKDDFKNKDYISYIFKISRPASVRALCTYYNWLNQYNETKHLENYEIVTLQLFRDYINNNVYFISY